MSKYLSIKHKINSDNIHLLDIFNNSYFLNLGVIEYKSLKKVLDYKTIRLDSLVYQKYFTDKQLKESLIYFQNISRKHISIQLFISYGLLSWKDKNNNRNFSPICLIPIQLFFEEDGVYVQQISSPIENSVLIKSLIEMNKDFLPLSEKLNTIYSLDKYVLSFQKSSEFKVSLHNYITFARLETQEIIIDHDRFNIDKDLTNLVNQENLLLDEEYGLSLFPLNITQKNALVQANAGNSFGIEGSMGVGKTTALTNIALNAISQGKRVLYLSNLDQTLENVTNILSNLQLDNYLVNLTKSFASMTKIKSIDKRQMSYDTNEIKNNLSQNYNFLDQYEKIMFSRVRNNHIIDILNSLVNLQDDSVSLLDVDNLDNIYKHEFEEIVSSLIEIEKYLLKFPDFQKSIWGNIPYTHNIKYPNQVITLIYKMHKHFRNLDNNHKILMDEFGIKSFNSYIKIREVMNNLNNLYQIDLPTIWLENNFSSFFETKELLPHLKIQLDNYYKNYNDIKYSFSLETLNYNIDELIAFLCGKYFTTEDVKSLDGIIEKKNELIALIKQSTEITSKFEDTLLQLRTDLKWDFVYSKDVFSVLNNLYHYISQNAYHPEWLKINTEHKFYRLIEEVKKIESKIKSVNLEILEIEKLYPKYIINDLESNIEIIKKVNATQKLNLREKYVISRLSNDNYSEIISHLETLSYLYKSNTDLKTRYLSLTEFNYSPDSEILTSLENLFLLFKSIKNIDTRLIIKKFLKKRSQHSALTIDTEYCNSVALKDFSFYYEFINKYKEKLIELGFIFSSDSILQTLDDINDINNYLSGFYDQYRDFLKKNLIDKNLTFSDIITLKKKKEDLALIQEELLNNQKYKLFGHLFEHEKTNIHQIEKAKRYFNAYLNSFTDLASARKALEEDQKLKITTILESSADDIEAINELFKLYAKLFKDKISKYYYDSFKDNVEYLEHLLSSKDELILFLNITEELKVLIKYKLNKLINYIVLNEDIDNFVNNFKYTYYYNIWSQFIIKYPFLKNTKSIQKCLQICSNLEKELISSNIVKIRKSIYRSFDIQRIRWKKDSLDYNLFLKKTANYKRLVLSNTKILNYYLDIKQFDVVIIDDAHLSSSNEYRNAIKGKQVIMAGERDRDRLLKNNLISRMQKYNLLNLSYRYTQTPKNLLDTHLNLSGLIPDNYYDNQGVHILEDDLIHYISNLFLININYKINLFIRSFEKQQKIINQLILKFQDSDILKANLYDIFENKLNIVRLNSRLLFDADFNIIYLEDYYEEFSEINSLKMINDLFTVKQKVIIYDNDKYLDKVSQNNFFKRLQEGLTQLEITYNEHILRQGLIGKLNDAFFKHNIRAVGSHNDINLVLEKNNILYGVLIFWDINTLNYQTIEKYRKYYDHFKRNNWKIFIIWIVDLVYNMDEVIEKIAREINV